MKIAYSTTVCPEWTLHQAIQTAIDLGFLGLEMRSFIDDHPSVHCDPLRMDPADVQSMFNRAGITPVALGTGVRYDKPIFPPVIGHVFVNEEEGVQETKQFVEFADKAGINYVRVYGYQLPAIEPRAWGIRRVGERLQLAAQTARNTNTTLLIENGGSFATAAQLLSLIEAYPHTKLAVSYNIKAAKLAGECPAQGVRLLKHHLHCVKITDVDKELHPVLLGDGIIPCRKVVATLDKLGFAGWIVYKYPKLWVHEDPRDPRQILKHASDTLYNWIKADEFACEEPADSDADCCYATTA